MQPLHLRHINGIDVSHHQGLIDWKTVANDRLHSIQFAFIKASEGIGYVDPMLRRNAVAADAFGLRVGYYHYCRPELGNSPEAEAEMFLKTVQGLPVNLPLVIDVEGDASQLGRDTLSQWVLEWIKIVQRYREVMIYTGASFAWSYLDERLVDIPLWVAHYGVDQPKSNGVWSTWSVFQYTDKGYVPGIQGKVDLNKMERSFFNKTPHLLPEDAEKMIRFLSAGYYVSPNQEARNEFNRLANALRRSAGLKEG